MSQKMIEIGPSDGTPSKSADKININLDDSQDSKENESLGENITSNQNTNSPTHSIHSSKEKVDNQQTKENLIKEELGYEPGTLEQIDSLEPLAAASNDINSKCRF